MYTACVLDEKFGFNYMAVILVSPTHKHTYMHIMFY